ncbi:BnaA08g19920D [Brassica napus]|uniref:BnaA08g19920D protein n=1 Tax=Brassica napus TaxID=3708 RepID=A0A078IB00_BRANA|nr:BnaA08g19920D [Brassica napus]
MIQQFFNLRFGSRLRSQNNKLKLEGRPHLLHEDFQGTEIYISSCLSSSLIKNHQMETTTLLLSLIPTAGEESTRCLLREMRLKGKEATGERFGLCLVEVLLVMNHDGGNSDGNTTGSGGT